MKKIALIASVTATVALVGCNSAPEEAPSAEPEAAPAPRVVTPADATAYRARLAAATKSDISMIAFDAPNEELRREAEERRAEIFRK